MVRYSYVMDAQKYFGCYRRVLTEGAADHFIMCVQVLPAITIRYDISKPSRSCVLDQDIDQDIALHSTGVLARW